MRNRFTGLAVSLILAATLAVAGSPGDQADGTEARFAVPILVYHLIGARAHQPSEATRLIVTPGNFSRQMRCLAANGYHSISLAQLAAHLREGTALPAKPLVLTFDDGWRVQYDTALPALRKSGMTATFFVVTDYVGHDEFMTWVQLRALVRAGMSLGSHSHSHMELAQVADDNLLRDEILLSKAIIERNTRARVEVFAYPYGAHDARTMAAVENAGYVAARADQPGGTQERADLYRLGAVNAPNELADFERLLGAPGICAKQR